MDVKRCRRSWLIRKERLEKEFGLGREAKCQPSWKSEKGREKYSTGWVWFCGPVLSEIDHCVNLFRAGNQLHGRGPNAHCVLTVRRETEKEWENRMVVNGVLVVGR